MRAGWLGIVLVAAMAFDCSRVTEADGAAGVEDQGGGSGTGGAAGVGGGGGSAGGIGGKGGFAGEQAGSDGGIDSGIDGGSGGTGGGGGVGGSGGSGGSATGGAMSTGGSGDGGGPPKTDCVVAVHADQCCTEPVAVASSALAADACLVLAGTQFTPTVLEACPDAEMCLALNCIFPLPPSRVAASDPANPGACRFVDECSTAADCTLASNLIYCCPCPEVFPVEMESPCLSPPGSRADFVCNSCGDVMCEQCLSPPPVPICTMGTRGYRVCADGNE